MCLIYLDCRRILYLLSTLTYYVSLKMVTPLTETGMKKYITFHSCVWLWHVTVKEGLKTREKANFVREWAMNLLHQTFTIDI